LTSKWVARTFNILMSACQRLLEFTHLGGSKEPSLAEPARGVTTS
jgi:hypothetical protein